MIVFCFFNFIFAAMRNLLAYFFLIIFSFQVLPMRAIGKIIAKGQLTEEVNEDCCNADDSDTANGNDMICLFSEYVSIVSPVEVKAATPVFRNEDLPSDLIKDIHCPPPNC